MSQAIVKELQRDQIALKEEINQLKTHMSLVMEILQTLLKKEGNPTPIAMMGMASPVNMSDSTSRHELPQGYRPQPELLRFLNQQPLFVPQLAPRNQMRNQNWYPSRRRNSYAQKSQKKSKRSEKQFDLIPMSYGRILPLFLNISLVQLKVLGPPPTPLPLNYNMNARCEFHSAAPEHLIESCKGFKYNVQELIDSKAIKFTSNGLDILSNLMLPHKGTYTMPQPVPMDEEQEAE